MIIITIIITIQAAWMHRFDCEQPKFFVKTRIGSPVFKKWITVQIFNYDCYM